MIDDVSFGLFCEIIFNYVLIKTDPKIQNPGKKPAFFDRKKSSMVRTSYTSFALRNSRS